MRHTIAVALSTWIVMGAVVGAGQVWAAKPFASWSDRELKKLLEDSPWAGKGSLTHARPGGEARPIEDSVLVTWNSALPIRQAVVRQTIGQNGTVTPEMDAFLAQPPAFYIVALKIQGGSAGSARTVEPIAKETVLRRDKKPDIAPVQAESHMLDKEGNVIPAPQRGAGAPGGQAGGVPPGGGPPAGGPPAAGGGRGAGRGGGFGGFGGGSSTAIVVLAFPRDDAITLDDKEVELVSRIGNYNVKKKFKLKDMVVNGQLAL